MPSAWLALILFGAVLALFAVAARAGRLGEHPMVYGLAVCSCCGGLTFGGPVGNAARLGLDVFPGLLGPALVFALCSGQIARIVRIAKGQNVTSIVDFIAVRHGKAPAVAALAAVLVCVGTIPFLALQLRSIAEIVDVASSASIARLQVQDSHTRAALVVALVALPFIAFLMPRPRSPFDVGRRRLMPLLAAGALLKLAALLALGIYTTWYLYGGLGELTERVTTSARISGVIDATPSLPHWLVTMPIAMCAAVFFPRPFAVTVAFADHDRETRTAAWLVPSYVVLACLMVLPITAAGLAAFPEAHVDAELYTLALPLKGGSSVALALTLIGHLAAAVVALATASIVVAMVVGNDLVALALAQFDRGFASTTRRPYAAASVRLVSLATVLFAAWLCGGLVQRATLYPLAIVFLVLTLQLAPAAIGGLVWTRGTARGAVAGFLFGALVWGYTLLVPAETTTASPVVARGPLGLDALRPTALFSLDMPPFDQAVFWSVVVNVFAYVVFSLSRPANANERLQAAVFVRNQPIASAPTVRLAPMRVPVGDIVAALARFVGRETAEMQLYERQRAHGLVADASERADTQMLLTAETLLASAIGAAAARLTISRLVERRDADGLKTRRIVDDVALEVQHSHDVLQHAIDLARDGMAVFDRDLRLVAWNRAYREMFELPPDLMRIGIPLDVLVRSNAERGIYGPGNVDDLTAARLEALTQPTDSLRLTKRDRTYEMNSVALHNGGLFFTYADMTAQVKSEIELEAENQTLEQRVRERTEELQALNFELIRAKAEAEDANVSKTRFLAAASHDILQPLSAARLYTTSLRERLRAGAPVEESSTLATHVDSSLEAVEDILGALLEISQLDAGATKTEIVDFPVESVLRQQAIEFLPLARERGLDLRIVRSSLWVRSDRRLLSRLLQNLISNAIKYTTRGGVVVGVRRQGTMLRIDVCDSGVGIPQAKRRSIFREFERLPAGAKIAPGAGLGLSIVERLARVLGAQVTVRSLVGRGSSFSVLLPRAVDMPARGAGAAPAEIAPRQRSLQGLVVVAVDNERPILDAMKTLLKGWDCAVVTGASLAETEATLLASGLRPDVILADLHIDDIDGFAVIAALRRQYGHLPAILVTADRSAAVRMRAHDLDVRVLNKPLKPAALRSLLSQWRLLQTAAE